jgi:D-alanine-D-alanine ligase-like ATP-grasp enzyme
MSMDRFLEAHPTVIPDPKAFKQRAEEFVLSIFQALEKGYGYGAEVGIDFGVDKTEKFWLIECNAQSAKVSLFNSYSPQEVDQTFVNLLMYAVAKATE